MEQYLSNKLSVDGNANFHSYKYKTKIVDAYRYPILRSSIVAKDAITFLQLHSLCLLQYLISISKDNFHNDTYSVYLLAKSQKANLPEIDIPVPHSLLLPMKCTKINNSIQTNYV